MELQELLLYQTDLLVLSEGDVLFDEGQIGDTMFVVMAGEMSVTVGGKLIETAGPGAVIGELSLIDGSPRAAKVVAKTDANLLAIDMLRFLALTREKPEFPLYIMQTMAERLRRLGKLL